MAINKSREDDTARLLYCLGNLAIEVNCLQRDPGRTVQDLIDEH